MIKNTDVKLIKKKKHSAMTLFTFILKLSQSCQHQYQRLLFIPLKVSLIHVYQCLRWTYFLSNVYLNQEALVYPLAN